MYKYELKTIAKPNLPLITLDEVKQYLRISDDDEDAMLLTMVKAATISAEHNMRSTLQPKILQITYLNKLNAEVKLPYGPITTIEEIALSNFSFKTTYIQPSQYQLVGDYLQLQTPYIAKYINITYQAGYLQIPDDIKQALLIHIGAMYESRINNIATPKAAMALYQPYKNIDI